MGASKDFFELRVYQLSEKLADQLWEVILQWDYFARDTVGKQLVRAADSVGANIAEGCGRHSFQDNRSTQCVPQIHWHHPDQGPVTRDLQERFTED